MAITNPVLQPKLGYVEVEVNGVRTYKNVNTGVLIDDEVETVTETEQLRADIDFLAAMTGVTL